MTAIDVAYRYHGTLTPEQMRALSNAFAVYGVRRIAVDEAASIITLEYDATRLNNESVAAVLRGCGIAVGDQVGGGVATA